MKIGYQGEAGSNAEEAAHVMAKSLALDGAEYVPLVSSRKVIESLNTHEVDYGVVAIKNTIGGTVKETFDAIKDEPLSLAATTIIDIHHCIFKLSTTPTEKLRKVASHIQALRQTSERRAQAFPNLEEMEIEDTAIGARWLAEGVLSPDTAVICRENAGIAYGLEIIASNVEDSPNNRTEFRMFKLPEIDYNENAVPTLRDRLIYACVTQRGLGVLGKALLVLGIFVAVFFAGSPFFDSVDVASCIGGVISALFLYLSSSRVKNLVQYRALKGYWKYYSIPHKGREYSDADLMYETPRIVKIDEIDDELYLEGWVCDKSTIKFFESVKTVVTPSDQLKGSLVYWYQNPREVDRGVLISGLAELNWLKKHPSAPVNMMSGRYSGKATNETGDLIFYRITKEEFKVHRECLFLGNVES